MIYMIAGDIGTRLGSVAFFIALAITSYLLLTSTPAIDRPHHLTANQDQRPKPVLMDGEQFVLVSKLDQSAHIVTFKKTEREAIGIALWNISIAVPDTNTTYNGVALLRHDRIDWRFFIELWLNPKPQELITDLLEDDRICTETCFFMFHSDRHQLIPMPYAQFYTASITPKASFGK